MTADEHIASTAYSGRAVADHGNYLNIDKLVVVGMGVVVLVVWWLL